MSFLAFCLALLVATTVSTADKAFKSKPELRPSSENNAQEYDLIGIDGNSVIHGYLGLGLPSAVGNSTSRDCEGGFCISWGDYAQINISVSAYSEEYVCNRFEWTSEYARELQDCIDLQPGVHWYGGPEMYTAVWPLETRPRLETPFVTSDSMSDNEQAFGGVSERYFVLSNGVTLKVDPDTPLFYSLNTTRPNQVCLTARDQTPYKKQSPLTMKYEWCVSSDVKSAYQVTVDRYFEKPSAIPDERMLIQPLWCTWAEYKEAVNQSIVLDYARKVISEGFTNSTHVELDDDWESCYGQEEFSSVKFPNPKEMIDEIHAMGMRVTVWVHPFVNYECPLFKEGLEKGYFVKDAKDKTGISWWWQGANTGVIDSTNPDAVKWWTDRLKKLQEETGIDSYKFDAGEVNWLPASFALSGPDTSSPNVYTTQYVKAISQFGGLVETRVGVGNQKEPIFFRLLDRDSRWENNNGLRSLIPGLFQFGMNGYPFILPDMIGGNNYGGEVITQEFYMRWMQINVMLPSLQFSVVPWRIGETEAERAETVRLVKEVIRIREKYADHILRAAREAVETGNPINRPLFWVDPTDEETFTIDDEYMCGDSILVAPVVYEGQTKRDIYLPRGKWVAEVDSVEYTGPMWLRDYPAPVSVVPLFVKTD